MRLFKFFLSAVLLSALLTACDKDETMKNLTLTLHGLENLGAGYAYEGWVIVDGAPVSTGVFTVDDQGDPSVSAFAMDEDQLDRATAFVLTIEPVPDNDPAPSEVHILGGDFVADAASLGIGHAAAIGTDLMSATGSYILATPTNGPNTDELSGVWWLDPAAGPGATLVLPALPAGWEYEGWAVIDGQPVTTGKFSTAAGPDGFDGYSDTQPAPPFPGEDFLVNAPAGTMFPTNLQGTAVVISVEPSPDNSAGPFLLKPLLGNVPSDAADHALYTMSNNASATNPSGTAIR